MKTPCPRCGRLLTQLERCPRCDYVPPEPTSEQSAVPPGFDLPPPPVQPPPPEPAPVEPEPAAPPAVDRRPTTDDRRPTTDDQRPTTDDRRPTTDDRRPTTNDRRPTTDDQPQPTHQPPATNHQPPTTKWPLVLVGLIGLVAVLLIAARLYQPPPPERTRAVVPAAAKLTPPPAATAPKESLLDRTTAEQILNTTLTPHDGDDLRLTAAGWLQRERELSDAGPVWRSLDAIGNAARSHWLDAGSHLSLERLTTPASAGPATWQPVQVALERYLSQSLELLLEPLQGGTLSRVSIDSTAITLAARSKATGKEYVRSVLLEAASVLGAERLQEQAAVVEARRGVDAISTALLAYAKENEGRLPPSLSAGIVELTFYLQPNEVLKAFEGGRIESYRPLPATDELYARAQFVVRPRGSDITLNGFAAVTRQLAAHWRATAPAKKGW